MFCMAILLLTGSGPASSNDLPSLSTPPTIKSLLKAKAEISFATDELFPLLAQIEPLKLLIKASLWYNSAN